MRDEILDFLRHNSDQFVSGQAMSEACGVSRTAIWKHIKVLRKHGFIIESYTKKGYKLVAEPDLLTPADMEGVLHTKRFGHQYIYQERVESTNQIAKSVALQGAEEGTVVVAEEQSNGRGRLTRGWYSPYGKGIWFSIVLRPKFAPIEAPKCTLMAAVALIKAFRRLGLTTAGIKWPNDILVGDRKLVGILTEMNGTMEEISYIVMGLGINTNSLPEEAPEDIQDKLVSFASEGVKVRRNVALATILEELEHQYDKVVKEGFASTLAEWKTMSVTLHQEVLVKAPDETYTGYAVDLDEDGNLIVESNGVRKRIIAGDVSIRSAATGKY